MAYVILTSQTKQVGKATLFINTGGKLKPL